MAIPSRNADPNSIRDNLRTFFVTSKTLQGRALLQSERMALLFIDVLRSYASARKFRVDEFTVMPNHFHLIITIDGRLSIQRAVQLMKGNFSYRAGKELGVQREIWQPGFSEDRIFDRESFLYHKSYIDNNAVKAGLAKSAEEYPYCSADFRKLKSLKK